MRRQSKAALIWSLRYLPNLEFLEGLAEDEPDQVSDEFKNRPHLEPWQTEILDAFTILSRGRSYGFSSGNPIALTDMVAMISINPALWFMEPIDLVQMWRMCDEICLAKWQEDARDKSQPTKPELHGTD